MIEFLSSDPVRLSFLVVIGAAILLQFDALIESIREARKGGDSPSDKEEPSPPEGE